MAVKDDGVFFPTEAIVSKRHRKHYKIPVRSPHWQLRSLISAQVLGKRLFIYFPGGPGCKHIQRLDVTTHECGTVKLLNFAPRCLVAQRGWLCCGSEDGEFAAIRLEEDQDASSSPPLILDPDARLPLSLDPPTNEQFTSQFDTLRRSQAQKSTMAKSMKMATDRVNCVTLWFPPMTTPACPEAYAEPTAVLANNDKTVTLVNLPDFERSERTDPIDIITYPDFVNRAIVSPDGAMLIAILDDPYLYVHTRVDKATGSMDPPNYQWAEKNRLLLKSQSKSDKSDSRGSFAACFSSSGAYLAVGTQHGTISVFDASLLLDPDADPLITNFQSSRPRSSPGAVRDMSFCPGPYDVLAWTEDRGHVGIADVRRNFSVRQIVDLNLEAEYEHINILDRRTIDPRLLETRTDRRSGLSREVSRRGVDDLDSTNRPFTNHETLVLEAIQTERRRQRERITALRNVAATQRGSEDASRESSATNSDSQRPRERSSSMTRAMGTLLGNYLPRERLERVRTTRQLIRDAGEANQAGRRPDQRWVERIGDTVAAMRDQRTGVDPSARASNETPPLSLLEIVPPLERDDRDGVAILAGALGHGTSLTEESAVRNTPPMEYNGFEIPTAPDNTAGLTWSEDGRTLFVGAQNGIYEFRINVHNRMFHPSIDMR